MLKSAISRRPPSAQRRRSTSKPHLQRRGNREGSGVRESKDGRVKGIKAMGKHEKFIKPFLSRRGTSVSDLFAFQRSALASRGFQPGVRSSWRTMPRPRVQSSHPATPPAADAPLARTLSTLIHVEYYPLFARPWDLPRPRHFRVALLSTSIRRHVPSVRPDAPMVDDRPRTFLSLTEDPAPRRPANGICQ